VTAADLRPGHGAEAHGDEVADAKKANEDEMQAIFSIFSIGRQVAALN
jgi:hypothetical protein